MMWSANFKSTIRHLLKHSGLVWINVLGLGIGLAGALLISLYVLDELSYDSQHPDADRIVRISSLLVGIDQGGRMPIPYAPPQVGPLLEQNFAAVEAFTRLAREPVHLKVEDLGHHEEKVNFVDPNFFEFFHFDWLGGTPDKALHEPDSIVLTEGMARRYFGAANPLGRVLHLQGRQPLTVTGLIRDMKRNTHLDGEAFITLSTLEGLMEPQAMENWVNNRFQTYLRLRPGLSFAALQPALHDFIDSSMAPAANNLYDPDSVPLRDIYLPRSKGLDTGASRSVQTVLAMTAVCIALLVVACINFVNLATARSAERAKEIALRKVLGARRSQIFLQYMVEAALLVLLSLILALGFTELALPLLNSFTDKAMSLGGDASLLLFILGLGAGVVLLTGSYPSLYLSAFKPAGLLKQQPGWNRGPSLRNLLVVMQFSIAIVLLIATAVIHLQVNFSKNADLGFSKEQVLVIENSLGQNWEVAKARLLAETGARQVSAAMNRPFRHLPTSLVARHEGGDPDGQNLSFFVVDFDYFELFEARLLAGRFFESHRSSDRQVLPTAQHPHTAAAFILNRAQVEQLGWTPQDALGKWFELNWSDDFQQSIRGVVVGVVEDMQVASSHQEPGPLLYWVPASSVSLGFGFVKLAAEDVSANLQHIDELWQELYPDQPIKRYFLDGEFEALYRAEERQLAVLGAFAFLAIAISCLGLYGLAAYSAERRRKEVGIRKTLGGSVRSIVLLLTGDFSRLVLLANLLAWPIAYLAMTRWFENFAYRIDLSPLIFIGSGAIALCIAWVTVGGTAVRAASAKPVNSLRYE